MKYGLVVLVALFAFVPGARAETYKGSTTLKVEIQKPKVTYVLAKQNLNPRYDLELKESFLPRVVESVNQRPF